jgi:hypothetical protein
MPWKPATTGTWPAGHARDQQAAPSIVVDARLAVGVVGAPSGSASRAS